MRRKKKSGKEIDIIQTVPGKPPECSLKPNSPRCESKKKSPSVHFCTGNGCAFI